MIVPRKEAWTTESELDYLDNIGSFRPDDQDKETFLRGYIASIPNRVRWAGIERIKITKYAKALLKKLLEETL